jgi:predicted GH43/DUF377 family glycosyl hydrolase
LKKISILIGGKTGDGMVKMYYGAADTCIALVEAKLEDITRLCSKTIEKN